MLLKDGTKLLMNWSIAVLTAIIIYGMTLVVSLPLKVEMIFKFFILICLIGFSSKLSRRDLKWIHLTLTAFLLVKFEYGFLHKNWGELTLIITYFCMKGFSRLPLLAITGFIGLLVRSRATQIISVLAVLPVSSLKLFWAVIIAYHSVMFIIGYFFLQDLNIVSPSASNLGRSTLIANVLHHSPTKPFGFFSYDEYQASVDQMVIKAFNEGAYTDPHSIIMSSFVWLGPLATLPLLWVLHRVFKQYQEFNDKQNFLIIIIAVYLCTATMSLNNIFFIIWCFIGFFYQYRKCISHSRQL